MCLGDPAPHKYATVKGVTIELLFVNFKIIVHYSSMRIMFYSSMNYLYLNASIIFFNSQLLCYLAKCMEFTKNEVSTVY